MLEAGVELYEIKPTASSRRRRSGGGWFGSKGSGGSSGASLHAKAFAFDRRIGFVGSYNLDPRSSRLNTEMGVLFDCPALAKRLPEETERDLAHTAYRVELDGRRLVWVTHEGDKEVRYNSEPEASLLEALQGQGAELAADRVDCSEPTPDRAESSRPKVLWRFLPTAAKITGDETLLELVRSQQKAGLEEQAGLSFSKFCEQGDRSRIASNQRLSDRRSGSEKRANLLCRTKVHYPAIFHGATLVYLDALRPAGGTVAQCMKHAEQIATEVAPRVDLDLLGFEKN